MNPQIGRQHLLRPRHELLIAHLDRLAVAEMPDE